MTAPVRVREATAGDAHAIEMVRFLGWRNAYADLIPEPYFAAWDVQEEARRRAAHPPERGRRTFVAECEGAVVGYASAGPCRDPGGDGLGEVWAIYVAPDALGRGAGRALMDACLDHLRDHPVTVVWTLRDNPIAHPFYRRAGFVPDGATRDQHLGGVVLPEVRLTRQRPAGGV